MALRNSKRPAAPAPGRRARSAADAFEITRLAASILADPKAASVTQVRRLAAFVLAGSEARKRGSRTRIASETTREDLLANKAAEADRDEFSGPSLGEMNREQRHKLLYGE